MARPRAIYASVPPEAAGRPLWIKDSENIVPVEYSQPYVNWPDLNWLGNLSGDNSPVEYGLETPQYLWSDPLTRYPVTGETYTFTRHWNVEGSRFTAAKIPPGDYLVVITHGADDGYQMKLIRGKETLNPIGANSFIAYPFTWRNVMTFVYRMVLRPVDCVSLTSIVTNDPSPGATVELNPAMFTWVMQVFDSSLPES